MKSAGEIIASLAESTSSVFKRNLAGFWLLGLTNNFAYVVMLSAATAILNDIDDGGNSTVHNGTTEAPPHHTNRSGKLLPYCNEIGTGAVLLADILPTLIIKLSAPFYMHKISYNIRVVMIVLFGAASFPIVATSNTVWLSIIGVVCASIGAGFGEITFLSLSAHFNKNVVSTWSSGTGGAGLFGSLSYLGLISAGMSPRNALLLMLIIPAVMFCSYFFLLIIPPSAKVPSTILAKREDDHVPIIDPEDDFNASEDSIRTEPPKESSTPRMEVFSLSQADQNNATGNETNETSPISVALTEELSILDRLRLTKPLLQYMIPLALVYVAEYFINQALFELIYFQNIWLKISNQYVWYQAIYQLGVFISRSSVNLFKIKHLWIMPVLQFANVAFLLCQIFYQFVPSIWIIFLIILFEGLLGGGTYVNAFYRISEEVAPEHREFSMGVASVADSAGITLAGIISVPAHNAICNF